MFGKNPPEKYERWVKPLYVLVKLLEAAPENVPFEYQTILQRHMSPGEYQVAAGMQEEVSKVLLEFRFARPHENGKGWFILTPEGIRAKKHGFTNQSVTDSSGTKTTWSYSKNGSDTFPVSDNGGRPTQRWREQDFEAIDKKRGSWKQHLPTVKKAYNEVGIILGLFASVVALLTFFGIKGCG